MKSNHEIMSNIMAHEKKIHVFLLSNYFTYDWEYLILVFFSSVHIYSLLQYM